MKAALFCLNGYGQPTPHTEWPTPNAAFAAETGAGAFQKTLDLFRAADEAGFDWVTLAEHHYAPFAMTPNPMVLAGAVSQVVKRAKIALLGPTIPILNPVRVAEELAMLDTMTGGRLVAGLMRGAPNEYITYNVNPAESRGRFQEALELIRMSWTEEQPFGWRGRYYEYRTIALWPRPVQRPHIPIFMSGSSPESGAYAAENRLGLGFAVTTVPLARKAADHYRACAARAGWTPTPDDIIYRVAIHVAETDEEAVEDIRAIRQGRGGGDQLILDNMGLERAIAETGYYGSDADNQRARLGANELQERIDLGRLIVGSPETALKQIARIRDELGAGVLDFVLPIGGGERPLRTLELIGRDILPEMHAL